MKVLLPFIFLVLLSTCQDGDGSCKIPTVNGEIDLSELGFSLSHEHIMSNYGKEIVQTSDYDSLKLFKQVIPYLRKLKSLGLNSIFDYTTEYFGRRIDLLQKISDSTGVRIITNTGFYGAANDRYIPEFAYEASAESISKIWIDEFTNGIKSTEIKPGFVKLAFDDDTPPSDIDQLFVRNPQEAFKVQITKK